MLKITDTFTGAQATCDHPEDIPDLIRPWYPDAPEEVNKASAAMSEWWSDTSADMAQTAGYLGIEVETIDDDTTDTFDTVREVLRHVKSRGFHFPTGATLNTFLPLEDYAVLARTSADVALRRSGEMEHDTFWVRIAFIKRALGIAKAREAYDLDRKEIAAIFRGAHAVAHARWAEERAELYRGDRLTGPALDATRVALGVSKRSLAHDLRISEDTVKAWASGREGYALPAAGIATELRDALKARIEQARVLIEKGEVRGSAECPIFTLSDDASLLPLVAILLTLEERRFNVDTSLCEHGQDQAFCYQCLLGW